MRNNAIIYPGPLYCLYSKLAKPRQVTLTDLVGWCQETLPDNKGEYIILLITYRTIPNKTQSLAQ